MNMKIVLSIYILDNKDIFPIGTYFANIYKNPIKR